MQIAKYYYNLKSLIMMQIYLLKHLLQKPWKLEEEK